MNCWNILHIAPTSDTRAIRKAYAARLKVTRPDDDAAAYQALREAFDEALEMAPYQSDTEKDTATLTASDEPLMPSESEDQKAIRPWLERVRAIIAKEGAAGLIRERMSLDEEIWQFDLEQRQQASAFYLDYLRRKMRSLPLLWVFAANWFDWWNEEQTPLSPNELHQLRHHKYDEVDWICDPIAVFGHLKELDGSGGDMAAFWQSYPDEWQAFNEDERRKMGVLLRHWRERADLPEMLRFEWQSRYPEFSAIVSGQEREDIRQKISKLNALYQQGGVPAVWAEHVATEAWLDAQAMILLPEISQKLLDLLRRWQTKSPLLWKAWGERFDWRDNIWQHDDLTDDEREHFYHQRNLPEIYADFSQLAEYWDNSYQNFSDGRVEMGYVWAAYRDDLWRLSKEERAQLRALMQHYLQHYPHRLPSNVFDEWLAETQQNQSEESFGRFEDFTRTLPVSLFPQDVADYIERTYQDEKDTGLVRRWSEIRMKLDMLPLGETERASWLMLNFLREKQINNPLLWAQWAEYFSWATDYKMAQYFTVNEMEQLKETLAAAEMKLCSNDNETKHTAGNGENDAPAADPKVNWWIVALVIWLIVKVMQFVSQSAASG